ncbi:MAG TPA: glycosyltransferase family 4 protein [Pirellulales bacterium]|nr:glycosyltransferase family 4 protein [Pirellulales bacterium]
MRIAHIITRMILGGAQENTLLTCEDLIRIHGDQVLLITGPALGPEGSLLERARAGGVPLEIVPSLRRSIHPLRDAASYLALKRILRGYRPDVAHTHSAKGGLLGRAAASAVGVPAVVHGVHGAPFHPYQNAASRAFFRACERWAARRCHAFISVADAMTELMVAGGVAPRERFTTIYSGMEVEPLVTAERHRSRLRRELGYSDEHVVIGKIARLFRLKGHDDVIEAARSVVEKHPRARFLFVGDGAWRERLERRIAEAGLSEYFRLTGLVSSPRVPELIAAMDIVVHASLREGLARVLPQGLIAGKPVVSYDVDGAREVVLPGRTGYLLPPRDVAALARALDELVPDAALRERLGAEGRRLCTQQFRHERMTQLTREVYERVLAGQRTNDGG